MIWSRVRSPRESSPITAVLLPTMRVHDSPVRPQPCETVARRTRRASANVSCRIAAHDQQVSFGSVQGLAPARNCCRH